MNIKKIFKYHLSTDCHKKYTLKKILENIKVIGIAFFFNFLILIESMHCRPCFIFFLLFMATYWNIFLVKMYFKSNISIFY